MGTGSDSRGCTISRLSWVVGRADVWCVRQVGACGTRFGTSRSRCCLPWGSCWKLWGLINTVLIPLKYTHHLLICPCLTIAQPRVEKRRGPGKRSLSGWEHSIRKGWLAAFHVLVRIRGLKDTDLTSVPIPREKGWQFLPRQWRAKV